MSLNQTIDALTHLLRNGDEADRCYTTQALGKLTNQKAAADVSKILIPYLRDRDIDVCVDVSATLGTLGGDGVAEAMIESLQKDPDGEIKRAIADALGELGDQSAIPELMRVMQERDEGIEIIEDGWDLWWDVQLAAVKSLGKLKANEATTALVELLDSDEGEDIEANILHTLAEISSEESIAALEELIQKGSARRQRRIATALGHSESREAVRILGRTLQSPHAEVRAHALQAMEEQDAKRYLPAVMMLLKDPSDEVRSAAIHAANALGEMKHPTQETIDLFSDLLNDESTLVRATSLNTLAKLSHEVLQEKISEETTQRVVELIGDAYIETSTAATRLFSKLSNPDAEKRLIELLQDDNNETAIRRQAALSLALMDQNGSATVAALTTALNDHEKPVRLAALTAMMDCEAHYQAGPEAENEEAPLPRPVEQVIAALHGEIDLVEPKEPKKEDQEQPVTSNKGSNVVEFKKPEEQEIHFNLGLDQDQEPQDEGNAIEVAEDEAEETATDAPPLPNFPESPTMEGESRESISTLDSIAMDNVEATLFSDQAEEEASLELDEEAQEYLGILEQNEEVQIRRERRFNKTDIHTDVRRMAATILGGIESEEAIAELNHALNDEDHELRRLAAEALARTAANNPANPSLLQTHGTLISQVHLGDPDIRMVAIRALGAMENRAALAPLIEHLQDEDTVVRMETIRALTTIAISDLDADEAGHMVTQEISNKELLQAIGEQLNDEQPSVRKYAADAVTTLLQYEAADEEDTTSMIQKILDAGFAGAGEQARHMGRALRRLDPETSSGHLLPLLESMQSSAERRFVIEMLEEIHQPTPSQQNPHEILLNRQQQAA